MDQEPPIKFESFQAGKWLQQYQYKSFDPVTINREWHWEDPVINTQLKKASRALAELDAFTLIVPDVDLPAALGALLPVGGDRNGEQG